MELKRIKEEINRLETYKTDGSITDSGLELLAELKHTTELVKNINYDAVLAVVTLENDIPVMAFPDCSVGDAVLLLAKVAKHSSRERLIFSSIENNIPHV